MKAGEDTNLKRLEIKKYANRRYYDTTHSRHLTLEEIRGLIQKGHDIQVIDAKTSTDITPQVLTQIILELETPKLDSFPVPLLLRLIRVNDSVVKDFIEKYFNQAFRTFLDYQQTFEDQLRQTHGLPTVFPGFSDWSKSLFNPFTGHSEKTPPKKEEARSATPPTSDETKTLLAMIQELRQEMAELKPKKSAKRPLAKGAKRKKASASAKPPTRRSQT